MKSNKIIVDFTVVKDYNPKYLVVADYSDWQHIKNKPAIIEVSLPGSSKCITHYFDKCKLNVLDSSSLGLNCFDDCKDCELIDLPDGVYTISVKGSPDYFEKTKYHLKTDSTRLEIDKLIIKTDKDDKEGWAKINEAEMLLMCAEANTRQGNVSDAQEQLFMVQDMVKEAENCIGCV